MPYAPHSDRSDPLPIPAFDCLGLSGGPGPLDPEAQYCPSECNSGLVLDVPFPSPGALEEMHAIHAPPGAPVSALGTAWRWNPASPTRLIMIYVFFHDLAVDCADPRQFTPTGPGFAVDFGELRSSDPFFYYSFVLNLDLLDTSLPAVDYDGDGHPDGSYQMFLATHLDASGPTFPTFPAHPLLNTTGDASAQCRVGANGPDAFDDAPPPDGVFTPAECHSYVRDQCPWVLGKSNAFFVRRCRADLNTDGFVDGMDLDLFYSAINTGACAADFNGDCFMDGVDVDRFFNEFESPCP
jgi:hypothetical protein